MDIEKVKTSTVETQIRNWVSQFLIQVIVLIFIDYYRIEWAMKKSCEFFTLPIMTESNRT
jgi:hypothetical protein